MRLPFYSDCVGWPRHQLAALTYLVDEGILIGRRTFFRHIDRAQLSPDWYPCPAGTPYGDHFFTLHREPIYWYVHSAIEFVFAEPATVAKIQEYATIALGARA